MKPVATGTPEETREVPVINPKLYRAFNKSLILAFYQTERAKPAEDKLKQCPCITAYQVVGYWDLLVYHLGDNFSLNISLKDALIHLENSATFTVTEFIIHERKGADDTENPPTSVRQKDRLEEIVNALSHWSTVPSEKKRQLKEEHVIIGTKDVRTASKKRLRNYLIFLRLSNPNQPIHAIFQSFIAGEFKRNKALTCFYKGESVTGFNYVIHMFAPPNDRDDLVDAIHNWAYQYKISLKTLTLDMQRKIADNFAYGLKQPQFRAESEQLLEDFEELGLRMPNPSDRINEIGAYVQVRLKDLESAPSEDLKQFLRAKVYQMGYAMAAGDVEGYRDPFSSLVEQLKVAIIKQLTGKFGNSEQELIAMKETLGLKHGNTKDWTFGDAVDAYIKWRRSENQPSGGDEEMLKKANFYRNCLVHRRFSDIENIENLERSFGDLLQFILNTGGGSAANYGV